MVLFLILSLAGCLYQSKAHLNRDREIYMYRYSYINIGIDIDNALRKYKQQRAFV